MPVRQGPGKLTVPNPFASIRIILYWDTFLIPWPAASPNAVWYCIQTSIPLMNGQGYGYNDLIVGLCFLPGGSGGHIWRPYRRPSHVLELQAHRERGWTAH